MKPLILSFLLQFGCPESISPELVMALIIRESNGHPERVSDKGAMGLMQIMPHVVEEYNEEFRTIYKVEDMFSAEVNVEIGVWHLCRWTKITESSRDLLQIYFVGLSNWRKMQADHDHRLWRTANFYVESIYYRLWIINSIIRIQNEN